MTTNKAKPKPMATFSSTEVLLMKQEPTAALARLEFELPEALATFCVWQPEMTTPAHLAQGTTTKSAES